MRLPTRAQEHHLSRTRPPAFPPALAGWWCSGARRRRRRHTTACSCSLLIKVTGRSSILDDPREVDDGLLLDRHVLGLDLGGTRPLLSSPNNSSQNARPGWGRTRRDLVVGRAPGGAPGTMGGGDGDAGTPAGGGPRGGSAGPSGRHWDGTPGGGRRPPRPGGRARPTWRHQRGWGLRRGAVLAAVLAAACGAPLGPATGLEVSPLPPPGNPPAPRWPRWAPRAHPWDL